ncbi:hypothetical protein BDZ88DRAFT_491284 [Geranomyces variabilis]|nr:hypothetical protein BDZ88DRAFT_491284 [Geranomyces variabilis]
MQDNLSAAVSDLTKIAELRLLAGGAAIARMIPGGGPAVRFSGRLSRAAVLKMAAGLTWDDLHRTALPPWAIADVLAQPASVLFLALPASGKTTLLQDVCRLATEFRPEDVTVLIDKSDEVRGGSAESHSSIPTTVQCLRLQKRKPGQVAMLAWRNFSPQTGIIDEIVEKAEAEAMLQASRSHVRVIATSLGALADFCRSETRHFGPTPPGQESEAVKETVTPAGESEEVKQVEGDQPDKQTE